MNHIESQICQMVESLKSNEIESIISELQMIADTKYQEEEKHNPIYSISPEMDRIAHGIGKLSIFA